MRCHPPWLFLGLYSNSLPGPIHQRYVGANSGGGHVIEYDRAARQQHAIDPAKPWNVLDPGLHSSFILSRSSVAAVKRCTACQGVDHTTSQCALASIEPAVQQAGVEPCRRGFICASWNIGGLQLPRYLQLLPCVLHLLWDPQSQGMLIGKGHPGSTSK